MERRSNLMFLWQAGMLQRILSSTNPLNGNGIWNYKVVTGCLQHKHIHRVKTDEKCNSGSCVLCQPPFCCDIMRIRVGWSPAWWILVPFPLFAFPGTMDHSVRVLMHWWELFVLAGTVGLMCSAEGFEMCQLHLLFGKRSRWGMPYDFWLTYWDICLSLCLLSTGQRAERLWCWWCRHNVFRVGCDRCSVCSPTSWTFIHRHLQLLSLIVLWLMGCGMFSVCLQRL